MRLMVVLCSSPYNNLTFQEGLDLALTQAAMGHDVGIVLRGLAVHALREPLQEQLIFRRNQAKMLSSAPLYEIGTLRVLRPSDVLEIPPSWCWIEPEDWQNFLKDWDEVLFW